MTKTVLLCLFALLIAGCNVEGGAAASSPSPGVLVLSGPSGHVAIGGSLDEAKQAFPPPAGAMTFDQSMSFAILTKQGWTWSIQNRAFEVVLENGKVYALALTGQNTSNESAKTIAAIGEPTRKAEGKTVSMYVWDADAYARILICMTSKSILLPNGTITLIGKKQDLKLLNYNADEPDIFVKQMDAGARQVDAVASNPVKK